MRRSLIISFGLICFCTFQAVGQFSFGPSISFVNTYRDVGIGGTIDFPAFLDEGFVAIDGHFYPSNKTSWDANLNFQYLLFEVNYESEIRPLAGYHFGRNLGENGENQFNFGLQGGLLFKSPINDVITFYVECKYLALWRRANGLSFNAGILF